MSTPTPDSEFPPVVTSEPQNSVRAIATGAILGGALAMANIYTGLKIGWGFNMSITAALLAFGLWSLINALKISKRPLSLLENNLNQTGASAAASISSAGLVSAVPALTMLDGHDWSYPELATWIFCCSGLGVFVAVLFRRQMLLQEKLPFASGIAAAETLKEMYARGAEAMARVKALLTAGAVAAFWKIAVEVAHIKALAFAGPSLPLAADGKAAKAGVASLSAGHVGFALDPSLLMVGAGAIIGIRIGTWMLVGAITSWFLIGGYVLDQGWVAVTVKEVTNVLKLGGTDIWTVPVKNVLAGGSPGPWLLWPGVALLVTSSLAALAWAAPQFVRAFRGGKGGAPVAVDRTHEVPRTWLWGGVAVMTALTLVAGHVFFGMHPLVGLAAVGLTGILAVVALRVSGETNVTPVGPMGKVTQLAFGVIDPGNVSTNLMAANVTGGSSSQAGDMMHDLKTGLLLGASPRAQAISQMVGVISGSLVGAFVYLLLIKSIGPKLLTPEWAAPAVAQWKAVAELFRDGFDKMPKGALDAMLWAGIIGVLLTVLEKGLPKHLRKWAPSPSAIGIAFLISAATSFSFFLGGVAGFALSKRVPKWYVRFGIVVAAGAIAGESLTGMVITIVEALSGGGGH